MHPKFLPYLIDPKTGETLSLEVIKEEKGKVIEGSLYSSSNSYPIVRGVPRFAGYKDDSNYTESFGWQWNKWSKVQFDSENVGKPMEGYSARMWSKITGIYSHDLKKAVIADIGCGPGRFMATVREKNGMVIGIDMSDAVEAAIVNFKDDENVLICQADVLNLPIKKDSLDGTFSIGVLHHTTAPEKGFWEMAKITKPDGWVSVSVYSKGGYYDNFIVQGYRKFFTKIWPIFKHYPPLMYSYAVVYLSWPIWKVPVLRTLVRPLFAYFPFIKLKDIHWSVLDTFDSLTPSNQSGHSIYEVFHWFKKAGLKNIEPSDWGGGSLHAKK